MKNWKIKSQKMKFIENYLIAHQICNYRYNNGLLYVDYKHNNEDCYLRISILDRKYYIRDTGWCQYIKKIDLIDLINRIFKIK